jgi:UDPglucose 6-dehydrogenase
MKLGVVGLGVVGSAIYESFETLGYNIVYFDVKFPKSSITDILDSDVLFICVPTRMNESDGSCDTSIVESVVDQLNDNDYKGIVVIKSTVVPGTTQRLIQKYTGLRIVCSPEFLRAKTALSDFLYGQDVLVIGTDDDELFDVIKGVHNRISTNARMVSPTEAEIIKYFNNVHHAVHVVFSNMMYDVSKTLGCSYENIYDTIGQRKCINTSYLNCNENLREFGGECLPKDIAAWNCLLNDININYDFISSVISDNDKIANEKNISNRG